MITFLSVVCFLFLAYRYGGDNFRWLGDEIEYAASDVKSFMNKVADKADDIGQRMHAVMGQYNKTKEAVKTINKAVHTAAPRHSDEAEETKSGDVSPKDDKHN
ncbi:hypothetical protein [Candidatus Magnetominusculus dajiuhuensis]|uniref:hypothetical protein n=1 Tax=Candidatus Magnetominusculus dajiuhuensis TaxID=3137712 RepID=UPI003B42F95C